MTRIGVAVPTLNGGATLPWTLLSLQLQAKCETDIVVVDSGSTDRTLEVCASMGVRTLYEPPGNMYKAVNAGLRSLDCTWLTYLNSDDVAYTDAYATLVAAGEASGADVVYGNCDYVDWHGRFLFSMRAEPPRLLGSMYRIGVMPFNQPCAVFRRSLFERLGGFDGDYRVIGDLDFFGRAAVSGAKFEQVRDFSVVAFRLHESQITARENPRAIEERKQYLARQTGPLPLSARVASLRWRLGNAGHYLVRRLRTGQWKGRPTIERAPVRQNRTA